MKTKYRIVTDAYEGYEVQYKKWWMPFYMQFPRVNTHKDILTAQQHLYKYIRFYEQHKESGRKVWEMEK